MEKFKKRLQKLEDRLNKIRSPYETIFVKTYEEELQKLNGKEDKNLIVVRLYEFE